MENKRKRRTIWSSTAEAVLLRLWEEKAPELRGCRKFSPILEEMAAEMEVHGLVFKTGEIQMKMQYLREKYRDEKTKMVSTGASTSAWPYFDKVHDIIDGKKIFSPMNSKIPVRSPSYVVDQSSFSRCSSMPQSSIPLRSSSPSQSTTGRRSSSPLRCSSSFVEDPSPQTARTDTINELMQKQNFKNERKRRAVWTSTAEEVLLRLWEEKASELRGCRKNSHILLEIATKMKKNRLFFESGEIQMKMQNWRKKYREEKTKMDTTGATTSQWIYFEKLHEIIGDLESAVPSLSYVFEHCLSSSPPRSLTPSRSSSPPRSETPRIFSSPLRCLSTLEDEPAPMSAPTNAISEPAKKKKKQNVIASAIQELKTSIGEELKKISASESRAFALQTAMVKVEQERNVLLAELLKAIKK